LGFGVFFGDCFLSKLNGDGSNLIFSTFLGGNGDEAAQRVAFDSNKNAYVVGWTRSTDFITATTATSAFDSTYNGTIGSEFGDAFLAVVKFDGTALLYATLLGGTSADAAFGVAINSLGHAIVTGIARGGFPVKGGSFATNHGNGDCFVACINPNLVGNNSLLFSDMFGGAKQEAGLGIAIDPSDAIYVCGFTESGDFDKVQGSFDTTYNGGSADAFALKLSADGSQLGYSTFLGGSNVDSATTIKVDAGGVAFLVGKTKSTNFPVTPGTFGPKSKGNGDGFLCKLSGSGIVLLTSGYFGANNTEEISDVALITGDSMWIAGTTLSSSLPVTDDAFDDKYVLQEGFLAKVDMGPAPILCLDSADPIEVAYATGSPAPAAITRAVSNCGSPESTLNWQVSETVDATWLSETPGSGAVAQGAAPAQVQIAMDPTGLAIGPHNTILRFENQDNSENFVEVPVLLSVQDIIEVAFFGGEILGGTIGFAGETDGGTFSAVKGMTLKMAVICGVGALEPRIQILNELDQVVFDKTLPFKTKTKNISFKFTTDGNYRLVVRGANQSAGDYTITTSVVFPKDAKPFSKKNVGSKVDGGPVDVTVRLLAGSTLSATAIPAKPIAGPLALNLLDPSNATIDVSGFTQPFGPDGLQLVNVPIAEAGLYTLRATGTATKKEKVNFTVTPAQPIGTGVLLLP
jgi:hypothetical protein